MAKKKSKVGKRKASKPLKATKKKAAKKATSKGRKKAKTPAQQKAIIAEYDKAVKNRKGIAVLKKHGIESSQINQWKKTLGKTKATAKASTRGTVRVSKSGVLGGFLKQKKELLKRRDVLQAELKEIETALK